MERNVYPPLTQRSCHQRLVPHKKKEGANYAWAAIADLGGNKNDLLPALHCPENERAGGWKKTLELEDYIFEVDNNSISHRPDLWGQRGCAREVAAILNLPLKPLESVIRPYPISENTSSMHATADNPFEVRNDAPKECTRFAGIFIDEIKPQGSELWMTLRLCRVDGKPMQALVDATNYVMLDLGQPLHAFDANAIAKKTIAPRMATKGEKLTLLNGQIIDFLPLISSYPTAKNLSPLPASWEVLQRACMKAQQPPS